MLKIFKKHQNFNKNREKMQKNKDKQYLFNIDLSFIFIFVIAYFIGEFRFYFFYVLFLIGHELSHFFVAKKLGYYPKKIKLNFFGAVLEGDDDFAQKDEMKIVLAGPFFNFCVIIFCYLCFWFEPETYEFLYEILTANWALLLFNILPIFPLDMGRFLLLFLSTKKIRNDAVRLAKNISIIFVLSLFGLFLLSSFFEFNFSLGTAAVNLMFLTLSNSEDTSYKRQLFVNRKFKLLRKGLLERVIYVQDNTPYFSLFKYIDDGHFVKFVFLDKSLRIVKTMSEVEFYLQNQML